MTFSASGYYLNVAAIHHFHWASVNSSSEEVECVHVSSQFCFVLYLIRLPGLFHAWIANAAKDVMRLKRRKKGRQYLNFWNYNTISTAENKNNEMEWSKKTGTNKKLNDKVREKD